MVREMIPLRERLPRPMIRFEREMDSFLRRFFGGEDGWDFGFEPAFVPSTDLAETENGFEVSVELPGMKPEDVHVELKGEQLWISGEKKEEKEEQGKSWHRIERRHGEFRRVIPLPVPVDQEKIEATFTDGVLRIVVPKTEEAKPKHIPVKA